MNNFTEEQKFDIWWHYKTYCLYSNYDLMIYDFNHKIPPNTIFRNELFRQEKTKRYRILNIATRPITEKGRFLNYQDFINISEKEARNKNFIALNINDWYERFKPYFNSKFN